MLSFLQWYAYCAYVEGEWWLSLSITGGHGWMLLSFHPPPVASYYAHACNGLFIDSIVRGHGLVIDGGRKERLDRPHTAQILLSHPLPLSYPSYTHCVPPVQHPPRTCFSLHTFLNVYTPHAPPPRPRHRDVGAQMMEVQELESLC